MDLADDSTGLRLAEPSGAGHGGWPKTHIAVDPDAGGIPAEELTRSDVHDSVPVPALLDRITGRIGRVYGDAAYAGGPTHRAVPSTGKPCRRGRHARHDPREGRRAWERATGYGRRNAAEWTFSRYRRVPGGGLRTRGIEAQRAEVNTAVAALNRMTELGMPRAQRVGCPPRSGKSNASSWP